jgi:uncharacterized protein YkwD
VYRVTAPANSFRALALAPFKSAARRGLALSLFAALALGFVAAAPPAASSAVHLNSTPATTAPWLARLNAWRATTGLSSLTENATWSQGDYAHAVYMVKNDLVTHYETMGVPYYSVAGDTAARNSNLNVSSTTSETDSQAIDWWMKAPFHALGMMDPRLTSTGFGSYRQVKSGWQMAAAVDTLRGNSFTGGTYPVYFPGNGSIEPLTTYGGGEWPDPLQACSGYTAPTGLPVFIEVGGNVATRVGTGHSFTGNGVALSHCVIDSSNPAVGSNLTGRGGVIVIPKVPLTTGVKYVVSLTVNGLPYTWSFSVGALNAFNPLACTSVTATATPSSPTKAGTPVTITANAAGCPTPMYRIAIRPPGGVSTVIKDYTASGTYVWNAPITPGAYRIEVDARDATSTIPYEALATLSYSLTGCTSAGMSPGTASPQTPGATVTFTATSTGCNTPQYRFFVQPPNGAWTSKTTYGVATYAWNTTGLAPGVYGVGVWVRSTGSTAGHESYWLGTYTLTGPQCTATGLSTVAVSPQAPGATVAWSGSAAGCPSPEYKYWLLVGGKWAMKQDYGTTAWNWDTTGLAAGTYQVGVWARQRGSASAYEAYGFDTFALRTGTCTSADLAANVAAPQTPGATITFTATSNSCITPTYEFWLMPPDGTWTVKRGWGSNTWPWNTSGLAPGTYQVGVWVHQAGSTAAHDAYYIGSFQLNVANCTSASISAAPASPQTPGTAITFTGTSTACTAPTYEFWMLGPNATKWSIVKPYGTGTTYGWTTTGLAAGLYEVGVWARQTGSTRSNDSYAILTFWLAT